MTAVAVDAPAKVNLFLEVVGRRADGYRRLATLFARLDLKDRLTAEPAARLSLTLDDRRRTGPRLGAGPDNLVLKAAEALREEFGVKAGARLTLEKRIPVGAGLGGGSSDAAAALKALSVLWGLPRGPRTASRLMRLARGLGADVPFFLQDGPLAEGRGAGDRLRPAPLGRPLPPLVLAYPGVPVSTAEAFRKTAIPRRRTVLTSLSHLYKLRINLKRGAPLSRWSAHLFNRLEEPVADFRPEVREAKEALLRFGARGVLMSGSGSVVFGFAGPAVAAKLRRSRPDWEVFTARVAG